MPVTLNLPSGINWISICVYLQGCTTALLSGLEQMLVTFMCVIWPSLRKRRDLRRKCRWRLEKRSNWNTKHRLCPCLWLTKMDCRFKEILLRIMKKVIFSWAIVPGSETLNGEKKLATCLKNWVHFSFWALVGDPGDWEVQSYFPPRKPGSKPKIDRLIVFAAYV